MSNSTISCRHFYFVVIINALFVLSMLLIISILVFRRGGRANNKRMKEIKTNKMNKLNIVTTAS